MFKIIILLTLFVQTCSIINEEDVKRFNKWVIKYQIIITDYSLPTILNNWIINDNYINETNSKNLPYKLGHNAYSGFSTSDFNEMKGYNDRYNIVNKKLSYGLRGSINYEKSIDWRYKNVVNPIKNQGDCAASWAFSSIASLESAYAIKNKKLITLSEQFLINCDNILKGGYNLGCNGGSIKNTFKWLQKKNCSLIFSNQDYQYVGRRLYQSKKDVCDYTCNNISNITDTLINKYILVETNNNAMLSALSKQPVSVAIEASTTDFYLYSSGIFTALCGTNLDHAVNLVGYDTNSYGDYYILRNSWGTSWGDNGYMYLPRDNYNYGTGQCGVLLEGIYPELN